MLFLALPLCFVALRLSTFSNPITGSIFRFPLFRFSSHLNLPSSPTVLHSSIAPPSRSLPAATIMERRADYAPVACQPWYMTGPMRTPGGEPFGGRTLSGMPSSLPPMPLPPPPPPVVGPHLSRPPTGRPPVGGRGGWPGSMSSLPSSGRLFGVPAGSGGKSAHDLPAALLPSPPRLHPVKHYQRPPPSGPPSGGSETLATVADSSGTATTEAKVALSPLSPGSSVKVEARAGVPTVSGVEGVVSGWAAAAAEVRALTPVAALSRGDGSGGTRSDSFGDVDGMDTESLLMGVPAAGVATSSAGATATESEIDHDGGESSPAAVAGTPGTSTAATATRAERDDPPLGPLEIRRRRAARNRASAGRSRVKKKAAAAALEQSLTGAREENGRLKERMAVLLAARAQLLLQQAGLPPLPEGRARDGRNSRDGRDGGEGAAPSRVAEGSPLGGDDPTLRRCPADGLRGLG